MHHGAMTEFRIEAQQFLACLSDLSRFRLVTQLAERERCVTELATEVGLSQSCTTRHLQALQRQGIVRGVRQGKRVVFQLCADESGLHPVLSWALSRPAPAGLAEGVRALEVPIAAPEHEAGWASDLPPEPSADPDPEAPQSSARDLEDFLL